MVDRSQFKAIDFGQALNFCALRIGRQIEAVAPIMSVAVLCSRTCAWKMNRGLYVKPC